MGSKKPARKTKTVPIEGRDDVEVYELTVGQIINLTDENGPFSTLKPEGEEDKSSEEGGDVDNNKKSDSIDELKRFVDKEILPMCTNIKIEDVLEMAPSDVKKVYEEFKKINETFFDVARRLKLTGFIEKAKERILETFQKSFSKVLADLSNQDTPESSTTGTPI